VGARRNFRVAAAPARELARQTRALGGTPFMSLLTLFAALLNRTTGQTRFQIGTPIANRRLPELEPLIGFFVNTLVLRTEVFDGATFAALLHQVRQTALAAYAHQDV